MNDEGQSTQGQENPVEGISDICYREEGFAPKLCQA